MKVLSTMKLPAPTKRISDHGEAVARYHRGECRDRRCYVWAIPGTGQLLYVHSRKRPNAEQVRSAVAAAARDAAAAREAAATPADPEPLAPGERHVIRFDGTSRGWQLRHIDGCPTPMFLCRVTQAAKRTLTGGPYPPGEHECWADDDGFLATEQEL